MVIIIFRFGPAKTYVLLLKGTLNKSGSLRIRTIFCLPDGNKWTWFAFNLITAMAICQYFWRKLVYLMYASRFYCNHCGFCEDWIAPNLNLSMGIFWHVLFGCCCCLPERSGQIDCYMNAENALSFLYIIPDYNDELGGCTCTSAPGCYQSLLTFMCEVRHTTRF